MLEVEGGDELVDDLWLRCLLHVFWSCLSLNP